MNTNKRPDPVRDQSSSERNACFTWNSDLDNGQAPRIALPEFISKCITEAFGWIAAHLDLQQCHHEKAEAIFIGFGEQLSRVENLLTKSIDSIRLDQARLTSRINQLADRLDTQSFNVEQIRTLAESSMRKTEQLANDFISRHVTDALFKEFMRLYAAISHVEKTEECSALAEDIERFLGDHGLSFIQPKVGDVLDPHQHHPIKRRNTEDKMLRGRIARTFHPGLIKDQRIIQPAQVEVFTGPIQENEKEV
jgi:molecular chaperone GrpE (heat shock protein)